MLCQALCSFSIAEGAQECIVDSVSSLRPGCQYLLLSCSPPVVGEYILDSVKLHIGSFVLSSQINNNNQIMLTPQFIVDKDRKVISGENNFTNENSQIPNFEEKMKEYDIRSEHSEGSQAENLFINSHQVQLYYLL